MRHLLIIAVHKQRIPSLILLVLFSFMISGCFFKQIVTNGTRNLVDAVTLQQLNNEGKFFILHIGTEVKEMKMKNITNETVFAEITDLPKGYYLYTRKDPNSNFVLKRIYKENILREVHLYSDTALTLNNPELILPISVFKRVDVYKFNKAATTGNYIWSGVGLGLTTLFIIVGTTMPL